MFRKARRIVRQTVTQVYNGVFNRPYGTVYMLHRIGVPEDGMLPSMSELYVSVERLERFLEKYIHTYDFISLAEVEERIRTKNKKRRKFIAFTLDDGYLDNFTQAFPIFQKYNVPFTIFLTYNFIDEHPTFNFPFVLEKIVRNNDELIIGSKIFSCKTIVEKQSAFVELKELVLKLPYKNFKQNFFDLFCRHINPEYIAIDDTLTWNCVKEMIKSPLCTIGAHTLSHCRLANVPAEYLFDELALCKQQIEDKLGREVKYISYPFGWKTDVNNNIFEVTKNVGYSMAFISWGGPIRKKDSDLFCVKREMLYEK